MTKPQIRMLLVDEMQVPPRPSRKAWAPHPHACSSHLLLCRFLTPQGTLPLGSTNLHLDSCPYFCLPVVNSLRDSAIYSNITRFFRSHPTLIVNKNPPPPHWVPGLLSSGNVNSGAIHFSVSPQSHLE